MKCTITFIVNPISGGVDKRQFVLSIPRLIDLNLFDYEVVYSQYPQHATQIAAQSKSDIVVVVGGDGLVNEVATALVGTDKVLGIIPYGSGNGLARHLRISMNKKKALRTICQRHVSKIDCAKVNGRYFFCSFGVGLDAAVDFRYSQSGKRGFFSYVRSTIEEWGHYKPSRYLLEIDGEKLNLDATLITIGNANQWGNNALITPQASVYDGKLDIAVMTNVKKREFPLLAYRLFSGKLYRSNTMRYEIGKNIIIERESSGPVHFDGEPSIMGQRIEVSVIEMALNVII